MFGASSTRCSQQHSLLGSLAFRNCMIAPVENRQHEFLPASVNPCRVSASVGFNEFGFSGWPERGLTTEGIGFMENPMHHSLNPHLIPNRCPEDNISPFPLSEKPLINEVPCPEQRKFLVFDQSGNDTRLIFSSLGPTVQNLYAAQSMRAAWNTQEPASRPSNVFKYPVHGQARKLERVPPETQNVYEESGENETLDEGTEMRENTDEINALLYSDDYDGGQDNSDDEDDDEVSSGHSPLAREMVCQTQEEQEEIEFDDEVASSNRSSKRRKALDGGHQDLELVDHKISGRLDLACDKSGDLICALNEGANQTVGSKRSRKHKFHDTLKVLESIIPGVRSKDPLVFLDEAISYLKCLKCNAETMFSDDSDSSSCYEPSN